MLSEGDTPEEFLENTKLELFQDRIYCFTPRGKLIALPPGATPIDFAYQVHTDVGNTCIGCRINGHPRPLVTPLQSGDEVEIIRSKGQVPPAAWESMVVTGKARAAIRRANRETDRKKFVRLGQTLIDNELARRQTDDADLGEVAERLGYDGIEGLVFAVGSGALAADAVMAALGHEQEARPPAEAQPVQIRGAADLPVHFARKHLPIPGDKIVGILDPGHGVTIYPVSAGEALGEFSGEPQRWLEVSWDLEGMDGAVFPAGVKVVAANQPGALAEIAAAIADEGGNIDDLSMTHKTPQFRDIALTVEVADKKHLARILDRLRTLASVAEAVRITN